MILRNRTRKGDGGGFGDDQRDHLLCGQPDFPKTQSLSDPHPMCPSTVQTGVFGFSGTVAKDPLAGESNEQHGFIARWVHFSGISHRGHDCPVSTVVDTLQ